MKITRLRFFSLSATISLALVACNGSKSGDATPLDLSGSALASDSASYDANHAFPALSKATTVHIQNNLATCSKKDKGNICVSICHRPPGNPQNSKTLVLPLQATLAHLKHGHSSHPDTIGVCGENNEGGDDEGGTSGGSSDGESTSGGGSDDGGASGGGSDDGSVSGGGSVDGGEVTIPPWCRHDIDSDCDGFHDETGESLL